MLLYMARGCPNCYGKIDDDRLKMGYVCENCLPQIKEEDKCLSLNRQGKLLNLAKYCQSLEKVELFKDVFHRATGNQPSSLQINWAKDFLRRLFCYSFSNRKWKINIRSDYFSHR